MKSDSQRDDGKTEAEDQAEWHPFEVWKSKIRPVTNIKKEPESRPTGRNPENTGTFRSLAESV